MISELTGLRQTISQGAEKLEIPPRPMLLIGGKEPYRGYGPFHGFDDRVPRIFRLTWTLRSVIQYADIQRYEVFACIQRVRSSEISRWKKIAEIVPNTTKDTSAMNGKTVVSRRMTGFDLGFRYQLVVRGVDVLGREGPFSKPVSAVV